MGEMTRIRTFFLQTPDMIQKCRDNYIWQRCGCDRDKNPSPLHSSCGLLRELPHLSEPQFLHPKSKSTASCTEFSEDQIKNLMDLTCHMMWFHEY
jgi:hypothetical protein